MLPPRAAPALAERHTNRSTGTIVARPSLPRQEAGEADATARECAIVANAPARRQHRGSIRPPPFGERSAGGGMAEPREHFAAKSRRAAWPASSSQRAH